MSLLAANPPYQPTPATPSSWRTLWPWYAALILASYAVTLLTDGAYWYATKVIHASAAQSLWLSAFWGLCYIPISLLAGHWAHRHGSRRVARLMLAAGVLTSLLVWAVQLRPGVALLATLLIAYNLTTSMVWPAIETAVTNLPGKMSLNNRLTLYNLGWSTTNCLALATVGWWADLSWAMIFIIPALVSGLAFLTLLPANPPPTHSADSNPTDLPKSKIEDPISKNAPSPSRIQPALLSTHPRSLLHMAWTGNAMCYVAINVLLPLLPSLTASAGFPNKTTATAIAAIWAVTRCLGFLITWVWTRWHYNPALLIVVQVLLALSFLAIVAAPILNISPIPKATLFISAQILFGFCTAFMYASSLYYAMHVSSGAGGHAGIHEALIGLGVAIGPTCGALFGSRQGTAAMWGVATAVTAILILGVLAMTLLATRKSRPT